MTEERRKTDPLIGTVLEGRYRIVRVLGVGGMGKVYLAEQLSIGRQVAVKVLHPQYAEDEEFVGRFRREAQQAAAVTDPRVVAIYEFGRTDAGALYLVMEYIAGRSLKEVIQEESPLPLERALTLAAELGEALAAVHRAGVIHRDVKPENVVVRDGAGSAVKLMDFGIARPSDTDGRTRHTRTGLIVGTPEYIAPEQVTGETVSARTDLYAWGIVLYELLSGEVPFQAATPALLMMKHVQEAPAPVRKLRREVPPAVEKLVGLCLAKEPGRRPRDMMEVVARLRAVLAGAEGSMPSTMVMPRPVVNGTARRGRGLELALGVLAALLAVVAVVLGLQWRDTQTRLAALEAGHAEKSTVSPGTPVPVSPTRAEGDEGKQPSGEPVVPVAPSVTNDDSMVAIPAGPFRMGCNEAVDTQCLSDEMPARTVEVAAFRIDRMEVTVADYRRCVDAGRCMVPATGGACTWEGGGLERHPINCVDWGQASAYCTWRGARLPTEAEWEKAARGTEGRKYPWGNLGFGASGRVANICDAKCSNGWRELGYDDGYAETAPVGSFVAGASPYGVEDMAGNVWEWLASPGPDGEGRGVRGGSWSLEPSTSRASYRFGLAPRERHSFVGFRCAE